MNDLGVDGGCMCRLDDPNWGAEVDGQTDRQDKNDTIIASRCEKNDNDIGRKQIKYC